MTVACRAVGVYPARFMSDALDPAISDELPTASPFLKWAGGKSSIAAKIAALLPADASRRVYREPFLGGGAMFFHLRPERAFLSDALVDLIATYETVQRHVEPLILRLEALRASHSREQYYAIRDRFNAEREAAPIERASWLIYLNKTCFNGLFRTNRSGGFNVPMGRYVNPGIVDPKQLRLVAAQLQDVELRAGSFEELLDVAEAGDLIYLDPPYVPLTKTSSFSSYSNGDFGVAQQERLAEVYRALDARGCLLALSNSDTDVVHALYKDFERVKIEAPRAISARSGGRGKVSELLVRNFG